ncbi:hypothetical protein ACFV16_03220 [Streptomyces massasporeus]|uniref:MmyB family transcriptional regulator n=1 Tax=Streptomyces massasporeus TaxID=67324 RepID=UPI00369A5F12
MQVVTHRHSLLIEDLILSHRTTRQPRGRRRRASTADARRGGPRPWPGRGACPGGTFRHPKVGPMTLTYEVMRLARTGGRRMVVHQAAPGTPDETAMLRLASTATPAEPESPVLSPS